jgi:hypothetical protein
MAGEQGHHRCKAIAAVPIGAEAFQHCAEFIAAKHRCCLQLLVLLGQALAFLRPFSVTVPALAKEGECRVKTRT